MLDVRNQSVFSQKPANISNSGNNFVCFIVPEYINRHIMEKGTEEQKKRA
jgi:hypothetical protein